MDKNTKQFINDHLRDDVHQLALKKSLFPDIDMDFALAQILGKQKSEHKIPAFFNCNEIIYPVRLSLEQASSQITAEYKASLCEGHEFIDLTGGFGVDTYFISRKFKHCVYVETQKELCHIAMQNLKSLGVDNISIIHSDAESYLRSVNKKNDWIYVDPARRNDSGKKLVLLSACTPDIKKILPLLLEKGKNILIKLSPMLDITSALKELENKVRKVHIVAVKNECKEILLELNKNKTDDLEIVTVNFTGNDLKQYFAFRLKDEKEGIVNFASDVKKYLYEPNAAILKSGGFNSVRKIYPVEKLHPHTHVYTSEELVEDFPGRVFEVKKVWDNSKYSRKEITLAVRKANITVRNFPESADILRKKLKLSEGGDCYLFACTLNNNEKKIIESYKLG